MMLRFLVCLVAIHSVTAFAPQFKSVGKLSSLTTVGIGASVAWDPAMEDSQERKSRFGWIRHPIRRLLRLERLILNRLESKVAETLPTKDMEISIQENVVSKAQEFRTKPIRIPSQPRPQIIEAKLAAKYAKIESLEERAFQILLDLNMVELHN